MTKNTTSKTNGSNKNAKPVSSSEALKLAAAAPASSNSETIKKVEDNKVETVQDNQVIQANDTGSVEKVLETSQAEVVQQTTAAPQAEVIQSAAPATASKAQRANAIFKEMFGREQVPARKDMIKAAMAGAGLTEKGAATYLQNYKAKNGLVKKTTAAA